MSQQPPSLPPQSPVPARPIPIPGTSGPVGGTPPKPLFHPASAVVLVGIDALWTLPDLDVPMWIVLIPLCFVCSLPVFCIQKLIHRDPVLRAFGVAVLCGVLAAVPFPVTGTVVGLAILAWGRRGRR
jgi:hypothetical protein